MAIHNFKGNNDFNFMNNDIILTGCSAQGPSMTGGNDNLKMPEGNNNSKGIKGNNGICVSILCHSRAMTRESRGEKNHYFLDTREGSEYDNFASSSCHSRAMTRESSRKMNHCFSGYSCQSTNMTRMISQSGCIPPSVTLGQSETKTRGSRITNAYASAFRIAQSGRSMVEMLGVLAVIGYSAHSYRTSFAICK